MKLILGLILSLFCFSSWAFVNKISGFENDRGLSEKKAFSLIHDHFVYELWDEANGYSCGGDFKSLELVSFDDSETVIKGVASKAEDGCESVRDILLEVVIEKNAGEFRIKSSSMREV